MALFLSLTVGGGISTFQQTLLEQAVLLGIDGAAAGGASWDDQFAVQRTLLGFDVSAWQEDGELQDAELQLVPMAYQLTEEPELPLNDEIVEEPVEEEEEEKQEEPPPPAKPQVLTHIVQSGETLWDIARAYGTDVNTIAQVNNMGNVHRLAVGQKLAILTVVGVLHTVEQGETLWDIARMYSVGQDKIIEANEIANPHSVRVGQQIIIPGARERVQRYQLVRNGVLQPSFSWPMRGRISSHFGMRWGRMHYGVDIAAPTGTSVRAAADGRVTFAGRNGGYGNLVIIDHGKGVETRYAHNSRLLVSVGAWVERGQIIARSGNTGNSTGPHLHFEIRYRAKAVDPIKFLIR